MPNCSEKQPPLHPDGITENCMANTPPELKHASFGTSGRRQTHGLAPDNRESRSEVARRHIVYEETL